MVYYRFATFDDVCNYATVFNSLRKTMIDEIDICCRMTDNSMISHSVTWTIQTEIR